MRRSRNHACSPNDIVMISASSRCSVGVTPSRISLTGINSVRGSWTRPSQASVCRPGCGFEDSCLLDFVSVSRYRCFQRLSTRAVILFIIAQFRIIAVLLSISFLASVQFPGGTVVLVVRDTHPSALLQSQAHYMAFDIYPCYASHTPIVVIRRRSVDPLDSQTSKMSPEVSETSFIRPQPRPPFSESIQGTHVVCLLRNMRRPQLDRHD